MKQILILSVSALLAITSTRGTAQESTAAPVPVNPDTKTIMYREVVTEKGTPGYLYDKAIEWFNYYYVNPISVFNIQDRTNGKVEGTGRMKIFYMDPAGNRLEGGQIQYAIRLEFKDDKYRYTITDFLLKSASRYPLEKWLDKSDPAYNPQWDSYLYQIDTVMQRLTSTLKERMKPTVKKTDDW